MSYHDKRLVDKLVSFHTNTNINLAYYVFLLVAQACKSTKIGFASK